MLGRFALPPSDFDLLCRVIDDVARARHLSPDEAADFSQWAHLYLLERNYAALERFSGRCSLRTYLNVVVRRLLLDWKNHHYGKWRPSVWARRLGRTAIELERLVGRDGHGVDEAVAILSTRPGYPDAETLHELAAKMPRRTRRAVAMSPEDLESLVTIEFEDPIEASQRSAARRRLVRLLRNACRKLSPFDQRLIHLRFERNLPVSSIAALLGVEARPLYRRIDKVAASLRRALVAVP